MPIFNLFFIAGSAASIAVAVFRISRDDGTDLLLSAKPMTKGITVGVKTFVFVCIMLIMCLMSVAIVSLIEPVFGKYDIITNTTGIEHSKYIGLILSIFVGNLVNMFFFGGVAVFIAMVGGQVITIIGNIGVVILLCVMNMIYPQAIKSSTEILFDKYNSEIYSYSCNTLHQFEHPEEGDNLPFNFATIGCFAPGGIEEYHFDTYEY
ncbi:MAG: hypothetical protein MJ219_02450 [Mycoplasmoidaceae bacterium]|nr:hypothetical protein [Mycoplasmoidaceae bacterium]